MSHELTAAEADARLRAARAAGAADYPWPHVPPATWRAALERVAAAASALLQDQPASLPQDVVDHDALDVALFTSGMGPLLGWWLERGLLTCDDGTASRLRLHLLHGRTRSAHMTRSLRHTCAVLRTNAIPVTVLKGAHTAYACFAEPALRPMSDIDLLVPAAATRDAERALQASGYRLLPATRLARPYRTDWRPPGASDTLRSLSVHHEDNPFGVDLHACLDLDFFGVRTVRVGVSMHELEPAPWAGPGVTALPPLKMVAHVAAHASQGLQNLTLVRLAELVLLLRRLPHAVQDGELAPLLQRLGVLRYVYPALALAGRLVPAAVSPLLVEASSASATPAMRRVIGGLSPAAAARRGNGTMEERFMWCSSPLDHVRRLRFMITPAGRGGVRQAWMERMLRVRQGRMTLRE